MRAQDGFRSAKLHRSVAPVARFRFVNVAEWESAAHFEAAVRTEEFRRIIEGLPFAHYPALYRVLEQE